MEEPLNPTSKPSEAPQKKLSPFSASSMFPGMSKSIDKSFSGDKQKNNWMYGPIDTKERAEKLINDAASFYFFLAALDAILGYALLHQLGGVVDGAIFAIFAFILKKTHKPWPAFVLLVYSGIAFVVTFEAKALGTPGGTNIYLAAIALWISVRAILATYQLKKFRETEVPTNPINS